MSEESPEIVQRWTAKRRAALVLSILKGETSAKEAARAHGLTVAETPTRAPRRPLDSFLMGRIRELIERHPTFGHRRLWAILRFRDRLLVSKKAVYRIPKCKKGRAPQVAQGKEAGRAAAKVRRRLTRIALPEGS